MLAAIRRALSRVTSHPVLSGKASLSVNTRYCTRYRRGLHMRLRYKPANWSAPRDDVWSLRMLPMPP